MSLGTFFLILVFIAGIVALVGYQQGWFNGDSSCNSNSDCSDGETCTNGECTQDGGDLTCKDYNCAEVDKGGWIDKDDKNNITCHDECTNSTCCTPESSRKLCNTKTCTSPKVLRGDANEVLCNDDNCDNCCVSPTCSTSNETCGGNKCLDPTTADKVITNNFDTDCCKEQLTCNDYPCSQGWMKIDNPGSTPCEDCNCTDETCCLPTCSTGSNSNTCQGNNTLTPDADYRSFDPTQNNFQKECCIANTITGCDDWFNHDKDNRCVGKREPTNKSCNEQTCPHICCPNDSGNAPQCCSIGTADNNKCGTVVHANECKDKCFWQDKINPKTNKYDCDYLPICNGSPTQPFGTGGDLKEGKRKSCEDAYSQASTCNGHYVPRRTNPGNSTPKYDKTVGHPCEWVRTTNNKSKCVTSDTWCKVEKS